MPLRMKGATLADKISSLITAEPASFSSDDENGLAHAKLVERYDETGSSDGDFRPSKIRRQNVQLLDESDRRYKGIKVSRRNMYSEANDNVLSDNSQSNDFEGDKCTINETDLDSSNDEDGEEEEDEDEDEEEDEDEDQDEDEREHQDKDKDENDKLDVDFRNPLYRERSKDVNFRTISATNERADIDKGNCVRSQLKVWESLLEMRIKLQKCLVTSNQMPQYDSHKNFKADADFLKKTNETKNKTTVLLNNMLELQSLLLSQYPETENLRTTQREKGYGKDKEEGFSSEYQLDEEIPSDAEDEANEEDHELDSASEVPRKTDGPASKRIKFDDYENVLKDRHDSFSPYRNSVIQKWNDKTRVAVGAINKSSSQTALKQIEFALSDRGKLRKRTQLKRSEYSILGRLSNDETEVAAGSRVQEYDPEIYDDDDFYHQLLRDLIEYKSSDVTDPIQLSKQWIQLQNMRRKMKRKIDTRATKGRRVRYNVHNKLVNFMAPITAHDTWTDLAKNELYNSLFGKIKPAEEQTDHYVSSR